MSIEIYYDGACPFCDGYARKLNLQRQVGRVDLIDLRSQDPRVAQVMNSGVDPNRGMVVRFGQRQYHGAEAVHILSVLSEGGGPLARLMRSPRRAMIIYPVLRALRHVALRLLGRRQIR